jgi:hypothetical protein
MTPSEKQKQKQKKKERVWDVAQVVEHLSSMYKALG